MESSDNAVNFVISSFGIGSAAGGSSGDVDADANTGDASAFPNDMADNACRANNTRRIGCGTAKRKSDEMVNDNTENVEPRHKIRVRDDIYRGELPELTHHRLTLTPSNRTAAENPEMLSPILTPPRRVGSASKKHRQVTPIKPNHSIHDFFSPTKRSICQVGSSRIALERREADVVSEGTVSEPQWPQISASVLDESEFGFRPPSQHSTPIKTVRDSVIMRHGASTISLTASECITERGFSPITVSEAVPECVGPKMEGPPPSPYKKASASLTPKGSAAPNKTPSKTPSKSKTQKQKKFVPQSNKVTNYFRSQPSKKLQFDGEAEDVEDVEAAADGFSELERSFIDDDKDLFLSDDDDVMIVFERGPDGERETTCVPGTVTSGGDATNADPDLDTACETIDLTDSLESNGNPTISEPSNERASNASSVLGRPIADLDMQISGSRRGSIDLDGQARGANDRPPNASASRQGLIDGIVGTYRRSREEFRFQVLPADVDELRAESSSPVSPVEMGDASEEHRRRVPDSFWSQMLALQLVDAEASVGRLDGVDLCAGEGMPFQRCESSTEPPEKRFLEEPLSPGLNDSLNAAVDDIEKRYQTSQPSTKSPEKRFLEEPLSPGLNDSLNAAVDDIEKRYQTFQPSTKSPEKRFLEESLSPELNDSLMAAAEQVEREHDSPRKPGPVPEICNKRLFLRGSTPHVPSEGQGSAAQSHKPRSSDIPEESPAGDVEGCSSGVRDQQVSTSAGDERRVVATERQARANNCALFDIVDPLAGPAGSSAAPQASVRQAALRGGQRVDFVLRETHVAKLDAPPRAGRRPRLLLLPPEAAAAASLPPTRPGFLFVPTRSGNYLSRHVTVAFTRNGPRDREPVRRGTATVVDDTSTASATYDYTLTFSAVANRTLTSSATANNTLTGGGAVSEALTGDSDKVDVSVRKTSVGPASVGDVDIKSEDSANRAGASEAGAGSAMVWWPREYEVPQANTQDRQTDSQDRQTDSQDRHTDSQDRHTDSQDRLKHLSAAKRNLFTAGAAGEAAPARTARGATAVPAKPGSADDTTPHKGPDRPLGPPSTPGTPPGDGSFSSAGGVSAPGTPQRHRRPVGMDSLQILGYVSKLVNDDMLHPDRRLQIVDTPDCAGKGTDCPHHTCCQLDSYRAGLLEVSFRLRQAHQGLAPCATYARAGRFLPPHLTLEVLNCVLNSHEPATASLACLVLAQQLAQCPPCAPAAKRCYAAVMVAPVPHTNRGLFHEVLHRLDQLFLPTVEEGEDREEEEGEGTLDQRISSLTLKDEEPETYATLPRATRLARACAALSHLLAVLEHDLLLWLGAVTAPEERRASLTDVARRPLLVALFWPGSSRRMIGTVNGDCQAVMKLAYTADGQARRLVQRLLALMAEVVSASEEKNEARYPNLGVKCTEFASRITSLMPAGTSVPRLTAQLQPSWLALLVTHKVTCQLIRLEHPEPSLEVVIACVNLLVQSANPTPPPAAAPPAATTPRTSANKTNKNGETRLHVACRNNRLTEVRALLDNPAVDVNIGDNYGWRPLHEAVSHGRVACVEMLLAYNPPLGGGRCVDVRAANRDGQTPLMDAAIMNRVHIAELLLRHAGWCLLGDLRSDQRTAYHLTHTADMLRVMEAARNGSYCKLGTVQPLSPANFSAPTLAAVAALLPSYVGQYAATYNTVAVKRMGLRGEPFSVEGHRHKVHSQVVLQRYYAVKSLQKLRRLTARAIRRPALRAALRDLYRIVW